MTEPRGRRAGGRAARRALRTAKVVTQQPFLTRAISPVELVSDESLEIIEHNADTLLEQVGVEIVEFPEAVEIYRGAGADIEGQRVRFPRGMCRELITRSAPSSFVQHARNPARSVTIGDPHTVFVPAYGSPFVREPRGWAPLRHDRRLSQLRQADASGALDAPRGRHIVRAGRSSGQQAPFRHALLAHQIPRQTVHGVGHPPRSSPRLSGHGQDSLW